MDVKAPSVGHGLGIYRQADRIASGFGRAQVECGLTTPRPHKKVDEESAHEVPKELFLTTFNEAITQRI